VTDRDPKERAPRGRLVRGRPLGPALAAVCTVVAILALVDIAIKSAIDLNPGWDGLAYHLPFAAIRGGLAIPYDMRDGLWPRFEGFPPLPELAQGLLWRLTGSVNATGVVNVIAFGVFLAYCHKVLRAPFWLAALISLTAPLVLIHTTVGYVDLFGNTFLAIGVSSCLYAYLYGERPQRAVTVGGLAALAAAAWCKFQLVPIVAVMFVLLAVVVLQSTALDRFSRRQAASIILIFATLAVAPYAKNAAMYGNPFWPERVPIAGALFPYVQDGSTAGAATGRPSSLVGAPQAQVFVESLFEIDVPTSNNPRWLLDQGLPGDGLRMGGFWGLGALMYLLVAFGLLIACRRRQGVIASIAGIGLLCLVAVLPQSNELRYYIFIPLTWAAAIGMMYPLLRDGFPRASIGILVLVLMLFGYMVSENLVYYKIKKVDYYDAAVASGAADWWPKLQQGRTYCVVNMLYKGFMITGPTMSEYSIVDRSEVALCPSGTILVTAAGIQGP